MSKKHDKMVKIPIGIAKAMVRSWDADDGPGTGCPMHDHTTPGKWDSSGRDCKQCAEHNVFRQAVKEASRK
ncbi:hypothetical protein DDSR119_62 [Pseudomonas phage DDSR119]|nr:hypothetical protein DDSR119_62 [Pseudomonas phage DDSR119]